MRPFYDRINVLCVRENPIRLIKTVLKGAEKEVVKENGGYVVIFSLFRLVSSLKFLLLSGMFL